VSYILNAAVFTPVVLLLLLEAVQSFKWRMFVDAHCFMYMAYLMDCFHYLPYRDFFDINTPGVYAIYYLIGRIVGYDDFGFRCADLLYLSAIMVLTAFGMRAFGRRVALFASLTFGLIFLSLAPHNFGMQKEYLTLLPLSAALLVACSKKAIPALWRAWVTGFLFGISFTIKPHTAIGLPLVVVFQWAETRSLQTTESLGLKVGLWLTLWTTLGFAVPVLVMLGWLWREGILVHFLDMAMNFWPLYTSIAGDGSVYHGLSLVKFHLKEYFRFGGESVILVPAVLGVFVSLFFAQLDSHRRRRVFLLCALAFSYSLYVVVGGKFWSYHWLMFLYFAVLLASLCLIGEPRLKNRAQELFQVFVLVASLIPFMCTAAYRTMAYGVTGNRLPSPSEGKVDEIADYLKKNLGPQDTMQAIGQTEPAIQAMLMARAKAATSFHYDFMLYYHVSNPYIRMLRKRFMEELQNASPRFLIEVQKANEHVSDRSVGWPELRDFIARSYAVDAQGPGYVVFQRRQ
jgi:hypothetical protein